MLGERVAARSSRRFPLCVALKRHIPPDQPALSAHGLPRPAGPVPFYLLPPRTEKHFPHATTRAEAGCKPTGSARSVRAPPGPSGPSDGRPSAAVGSIGNRICGAAKLAKWSGGAGQRGEAAPK